MAVSKDRRKVAQRQWWSEEEAIAWIATGLDSVIEMMDGLEKRRITPDPLFGIESLYFSEYRFLRDPRRHRSPDFSFAYDLLRLAVAARRVGRNRMGRFRAAHLRELFPRGRGRGRTETLRFEPREIYAAARLLRDTDGGTSKIVQRASGRLYDRKTRRALTRTAVDEAFEDIETDKIRLRLAGHSTLGSFAGVASAAARSGTSRLAIYPFLFGVTERQISFNISPSQPGELPTMLAEIANVCSRRGRVDALPALCGAPDETLLTRAEMSALTGNAVVTLRLWEKQGRGAPVVRVEGRPRYRLGDVRRWLNVAA